jgi:hypothetical protein
VRQAVEELREPLQDGIGMVFAEKIAIGSWQELSKFKSVEIFGDDVQTVRLKN